jgi:hypothetical protein
VEPSVAVELVTFQLCSVGGWVNFHAENWLSSLRLMWLSSINPGKYNRPTFLKQWSSWIILVRSPIRISTEDLPFWDISWFYSTFSRLLRDSTVKQTRVASFLNLPRLPNFEYSVLTLDANTVCSWYTIVKESTIHSSFRESQYNFYSLKIILLLGTI